MPLLFHLLLTLLLWIGSCALAWAVPAERPRLPEPLGYVSDHAQTLDADWKARIRSVCQDLERKTGVEMVVVTVPTVKPFASAQLYAEALYQQWKIGSASEEHGALILLAVAEHQAAITVGKRMVPIFTPEVVAKVGSEYMDQALRMGHFGEGLYRTVVGLAANAQNVRVGPPPRSHMKGLGFLISLLTVVAAVLVLWWISRPDLRHPYGKIRRGEYWGSGQGGFGGNFGGLGGTMGGDGLG
ncbi:TPM_phosphatase domain-containing protein [Nitrospira tepida]|uniref:TPM_phosphatase domain-containing protein n=1 Tax=Nitrospira tepida TaxID=2973512 RepID=A0AA86MZC3_9BACT|nr:TPM domain-containing protein [Nitrospira tepida]CAI4031858.1 TPM_phosphatase domain-containing protein [Nitrospira tepida]